MATSGISRHSFLAPIGNERRNKMPIRDKVRAYKEAPIKAIQIAVAAFLVAILALMVSLGKK